MVKLFQKVKNLGAPPGVLIPDASKQDLPAKITVIDYDESRVEEKEVRSIDECFRYKDTPQVTWINIDGRDIDVIRKIDEHFGIHPLVLEDIFDVGQRPKTEDYDGYVFIVLKMIYVDGGKDDIIAEQISLILGKNYCLSFQEKPGDVFDLLRDRIRQGKGRVRKMGADYLAYTMLDAIVDQYFVVLEKLGAEIEEIEDELADDIRPDTPVRIHNLKRKIIFLRKQIWPLRDLISGLQRNESKLIKKSTEHYLRDVYDHTIQVMDAVEAFRDALSGMHDIYLSGLSNRMNEIMKTLTIFAAIFIPLTFIAGIYGMNFEYMPELRWRHGYFAVITVMLTLGAAMLLYFRKKDWL